MTVTARIEGPASRLLRTGTRFWLRGARPTLDDPASWRAILAGPTIVLSPGPGEETTRFAGLVHEPIPPPGASDEGERFRVAFDGAVGSLEPGHPVELRGFPVGRVDVVRSPSTPMTEPCARPWRSRSSPRSFACAPRSARRRCEARSARSSSAGSARGSSATRR